MHLGHREFTDGQTRAVYLDDDNQQYVLTEDGPVYGEWLQAEPGTVRAEPQADTPILVWHNKPSS